MKWLKPCVNLMGIWWNRLQHVDGVWRELDAPDFETFCKVIMRSDLIMDFGYGYGRVTDLVYGHRANVHAVFWSKEAWRNPEPILVGLTRLSLEYKLMRIECVVPAKSKGLRRFLENRLFFHLEGVLKNYYRLSSGFEDAAVYAMA